jgi:hypothetical protein
MSAGLVTFYRFFDSCRIIDSDAFGHGISRRFWGREIDIDLFEKFIEMIARIVQSLDELYLIFFRINISRPSQYDHLDLIGRMTSEAQAE